MSIATNSETTSVEARERWLPQELRRKGAEPLWQLSDWRKTARHCHREPALLGPYFRFRRTLHGRQHLRPSLDRDGAHRISGLDRTVLHVGSLQQRFPASGRTFAGSLLGTLAFVATFFVVSGDTSTEHLARGRLPGRFGFSARLLRRSPDAPCPHSAQAVGSGDGLCRQRRSHRASPPPAFRNS